MTARRRENRPRAIPLFVFFVSCPTFGVNLGLRQIQREMRESRQRRMWEKANGVAVRLFWWNHDLWGGQKEAS